MNRIERVLGLGGWAVAAAILLAGQALPVPSLEEGVVRGSSIELTDDEGNIIFWVGPTEHGTVARLTASDPLTGVFMHVDEETSQLGLYGDGTKPVIRMRAAENKRGIMTVHDIESRSLGVFGVNSSGVAMCDLFTPAGQRGVQFSGETRWGFPAVIVKQGEDATALAPKGVSRRPNPPKDL